MSIEKSKIFLSPNQYTERINYNNKKYNVYEDIGGKTDENDKCINETLLREIFEETNNIISKEIITKHLAQNNYYIYSLKSKYYLLLVKASKEISYIDRSLYGDKELLSNKKHKFYWIYANRLSSGTPFNERIWIIRNKIIDFFSTLN